MINSPSPPPQSGGGGGGNLSDMSLQKNVAGQNTTFVAINPSNGLPATGLSFVGAAWISKDGVQLPAGGTFTELPPTGKGIYNYKFTQSETNANCVSLFVAPVGAFPLDMIFLTSGLHRNSASPQQHITFGMSSVSGVADPSATVTVEVCQDGGSLSAGGGPTVANLGNGQFDYQPTAGETNGANCNFSFSSPGDVTRNFSIYTVP